VREWTYDRCHLIEGFRDTWAKTLRRPIKPFEACLRRMFVTVSQFVQTISTASIKITDRLW
jgi:hypothetical protein